MSDSNKTQNKQGGANDNVTAFPADAHHKATIKEEAGAWIVRLDQGELTAEQVLALQEWLGRSDFHREYLEKLARNWDSMSILQELAELFPLSNAEPQAAAVSNRASAWRNWPVWGVAMAASVLLAFVWFGGQGLQQAFVTGIGEQGTYTLEDGSTIVLNTNSHIDVDYSGGRRALTLRRGEASFDVAKNPQRPFVVYAGKGMVWAVGTAFNVRYTSDLVDVTVTEGTVKVYTEVTPTQTESTLSTASTGDGGEGRNINQSIAGREAIVDAGNSIRFGERIEQIAKAAPAELEQKLAWQHGALVFKGETLEQALAEINRYTDKELVIIDPDIKNIRVGGHYKTDDIDGLLASLSQGFGIDVQTITDSRIHLSGKRSQ